MWSTSRTVDNRWAMTSTDSRHRQIIAGMNDVLATVKITR